MDMLHLGAQRKRRSGETSLQRSFPRTPFKKLYHLWLADFLGKKISKPEHIEKFLEGGLGRNLFSKRFLPRLLS
jgi:hypothetical protein